MEWLLFILVFLGIGSVILGVGFIIGYLGGPWFGYIKSGIEKKFEGIMGKLEDIRESIEEKVEEKEKARAKRWLDKNA